jgi:hypothetical protein
MLAFGDEPARIAALHDQQNALTEELRTTTRQKVYRRWKAKLEHLNSAIGASEYMDAELRARCQTALRRVLETGEPGDAPAALAALHQQIPNTGDGPSLRHSAVWGLMKQLAVSGAIPSRPSGPDRVEVLESERTQAREQERAMREHLHLSSAVIAAYTQVFAAPTVEPVPGRGALRGWTIQYIDCMETPAPRVTDRRG